jgi:hypothetical protein
VAEKLLGKYSDLEAGSVMRVVPSTVLLTALHYRAIPDGPPLSYVTAYNSMSHMFAKHANKDERKPEEIKWDALLRRLQISYADEYENIVCSYLASGSIDEEKLGELIQSYRKSTEENEAQRRVRSFLDDYFWNPSLDVVSLLGTANKFLDESIRFIDSTSITAISDAVDELGDSSLATSLIDEWIRCLDERVDMSKITEDSFERFHQKIHPRILFRFESIKEKKFPALSLGEAIAQLAANTGYGSPRVEAALLQTTVAQYEETLRGFRGGEIADFIQVHCSWAQIGGRMENPAFATAMSNFESACRNICVSDPEARFAVILKREFGRYGLAEKLNLQINEAN